MFSTAGLFREIACPDGSGCNRVYCLFSHAPTTLPDEPGLKALETLFLPQKEPSQRGTPDPQSQKRPSNYLAPPSSVLSSNSAVAEPPRKQQRTSLTTSRATSASILTTGVPVLRVNAAASQVAVPVRQAMIKNLFDHFVVLYEAILPNNPTIASEHTLKQEAEVYAKTSKTTYRNAVINSIAALKRREKPDTVNHLSVGTEDEIAAKSKARDALQALSVTRQVLWPLVMSLDTMKAWGYITETPAGVGGDMPTMEGQSVKCERCQADFRVDSNFGAEDCLYHWGRVRTSKVNGDRVRFFTCCLKSSSESPGCVRGPHVFYEHDPSDLHARHAFSYTVTAPADKNTALDVVALDCEMVYTTGGLRVARVSVIDGNGKEIMDELIRMDEGVHIIDYNTRFSGITAETHDKATLNLESARLALNDLINSETIIIGHALDNDLKTLRMLHFHCVDTVVLFPHKMGAPYRRSLRDLAKEILGMSIQQGGGTSGHSSVEDSVATLDLVRWHILNKKPPVPAPITP